MRCPLCKSTDNKVIDSRLNKEGDAIRRRRECLPCSNRFTTYEQIETPMPLVIKKDGRREPFDGKKILKGIKRACEKRAVSISVLEDTVMNIEKFFYEKGEKEISAILIGEKIMHELYQLDEIAYVRFASVYRSFKDVNDFIEEIKDLLHKKNGN